MRIMGARRLCKCDDGTRRRQAGGQGATLLAGRGVLARPTYGRRLCPSHRPAEGSGGAFRAGRTAPQRRVGCVAPAVFRLSARQLGRAAERCRLASVHACACAAHSWVRIEPPRTSCPSCQSDRPPDGHRRTQQLQRRDRAGRRGPPVNGRTFMHAAGLAHEAHGLLGRRLLRRHLLGRRPLHNGLLGRRRLRTAVAPAPNAADIRHTTIGK